VTVPNRQAAINVIVAGAMCGVRSLPEDRQDEATASLVECLAYIGVQADEICAVVADVLAMELGD
jgi:hypothetical protein